MMLLLHSGASSNSSYITQTLRSLTFNRKIYHHHYSHSLSSSSVWKIINVNGRNSQAIHGIGMLAAAVVLSTPAPSEETLSNIPQELSVKTCHPMDKECDQGNMRNRIQRPKSRNAESCTTKCVGTCIRGGDGSLGEGPLNIRMYYLLLFLSKDFEVDNIAWWNVQIYATCSIVLISAVDILLVITFHSVLQYIYVFSL